MNMDVSTTHICGMCQTEFTKSKSVITPERKRCDSSPRRFLFFYLACSSASWSRSKSDFSSGGRFL